MARRPSSKPPAAPALAQADEHGVAIKRDGKGRIVPRASDGTTLGDRIRAARAAVVPPLTQEDIANAFEITPNAVTNWENDTSRPGGRKFARLAELLRTDLKQLLAGPPAPAAEDGGRDRRFKDNYQIPVALYGGIALESTTGLREEYQASRVQAAQAFVAAFHDLQAAVRAAAAAASAAPAAPPFPVIGPPQA